MNKIAVSFLIIATTLLSTACMDYSISAVELVDSKESAVVKKDEDAKEETTSKMINSKKTTKIPIEIISKDEKIVKYLQIDEESSLKDKLRLILDTLSNEYFNGLDMEIEVKEKDNLVKINLIEPDKKSRVSWKDDYLNEQNIIYTINNIIKNVIQEEDNSIWIEEVEIYYNGKLIELR
ncbi:TPA: hypothetical protein KRQ71_001396 [Clostridioides difficile]|uniref:hypothetical protein n=1 Tax=Clostridioides difficile TaxID=1496 RepID=UPI0010B17D63|nr:hypothetical protein [Clostridioides difficile]EJA6796557.1 hypothetical protein [Clostridioides difficile]MBF4704669.1 hypothetical protein [Clostridioides difficile]MBH7194653.1 hypothetical protein [Clostridioides difficile]MBH7520235.1 hypothetical protein [Clostridioides difficile]MBY2357951.1 hypothetical protein [Clostridioides difficile]